MHFWSSYYWIHFYTGNKTFHRVGLYHRTFLFASLSLIIYNHIKGNLPNNKSIRGDITPKYANQTKNKNFFFGHAWTWRTPFDDDESIPYDLVSQFQQSTPIPVKWTKDPLSHFPNMIRCLFTSLSCMQSCASLKSWPYPLTPEMGPD